MGVSKNRGTPKWMAYNGKPYAQMDDFWGPPLFLETPISGSLGYGNIVSRASRLF